MWKLQIFDTQGHKYIRDPRPESVVDSGQRDTVIASKKVGCGVTWDVGPLLLRPPVLPAAMGPRSVELAMGF